MAQMLCSPPRVGWGRPPSSFGLCELERQAGRCAVFINVEGCHDELAFAEKLVDGLTESGLHPEPLSRVSLVFRKARQALSGHESGRRGR